MTEITRHTDQEHADSLARYMPGGPLFDAASVGGTVMRRLIEGLAVEIGTGENFLKLLQDEFIPDTTTLLLDEWESAVGIPDDCFPKEDDPDIRRRNILIKLASLGVQTVEDFQNLADLFGLNVTVRPGSEVFPFPLDFPISFVASTTESRFTIVIEFEGTPPGVVTFPYPFPLLFGETEQTVLSCLFEKLKPANCRLIIIGV